MSSWEQVGSPALPDGEASDYCFPDLDSASAAGAAPFSDPVAHWPNRCFPKEAMVLTEEGTAVKVTNLPLGTSLRSLTRGPGGEFVLSVTPVFGVRMVHKRDVDVSSVYFGDAAAKMSIDGITSKHGLLAAAAGHGWAEVAVEDLRPRHRLRILSSLGEAILTDMNVVGIDRGRAATEVVELELANKADVLFMQVTGGDAFVAVFGSPGFPQNLEVRVKNGSLDVGAVAPVDAQSHSSDPTHMRLSRQSEAVYRVSCPHNAACQRPCNFYFSERGCSKRPFCTFCHHEDHREEVAYREKAGRKTHRGRKAAKDGERRP